jgi:hypothetical protein
MRIVHSVEELLDLPRDEHVNGFSRREPLLLEIPALTYYALADAQDALNGLQERRGSLTAASSALFALILGMTAVVSRNTTMFTGHALLELGAVMAIAIGVGAIARMVALTFTRWQFERRCREQYEELSRMLREPAFLS